jgi:diguanylate cyclase (GGDEF)-like protein
MVGLEPNRPPLVLVANDEEWWARSLESLLSPGGYAILRAYTGRQTLERAHEVGPDLIILDASLPDIPGIELCRRLRSDRRVSSATPILITTAGRCTREERLEALSAGAWDFIGLPLDADDLILRLNAYMRAKLEAERTKEEGLIDPLTGLYNLQGLRRRARELGTDAYRHGRALACVALALRIEDPSNSDSSDVFWDAIDRAGTVLRDSGRISDAIGRIRDGEFVIIAPETDDTGAHQLAQRLSTEVEEIMAVGESMPPVQVLAGYSAVPNLQSAGVRPSAILANAKMALSRLQAQPGGSGVLRYEGDYDDSDLDDGGDLGQSLADITVEPQRHATH